MDKKILLVFPPQRRHELLKLLDGNNHEILLASTCQEACRKLSGPQSRRVDLILIDSELPDGSWQDVLQFVLETKRQCEMIVCSRRGNEQLWAEALQCGAFDLLIEPYEQPEVYRMIESALDTHYMRTLSCRVPPAARAS